MGCADGCEGELPAERPSLLGSAAVRASALAWLLIAAGLVAGWVDRARWVEVILLAGAIVAGSFYFAREALAELWEEKEVGIELLMTVAIAAAAALGNWREGALVAGLFSITEALEGFTIQRTRYAIRGLMDLVPPKARVLRDGVEVEIDVESVQIGDLVIVRPGEAVSNDGVIRNGSSAINESPVTGESMPAERTVGDQVFAGTLNGNGALQIQATKAFKDNTVSRIIEMVEKAQQQKGQSQRLVERFGRVYSPSVLAVAVLVALLPLLVGGDWSAWLTKAAAFLVAASPCALAVATPVTLLAAIGAGARRGVLIKGGNVVEQLGRTVVVAVDKTGTLTTGRPRLVDVHVIEGTADELIRTAASVEHYSEHPLAKAIVDGAKERGLSLLPVGDFKALTGAGVEGRLANRSIAVLKPSAAVERGVPVPDGAQVWSAAAAERGSTVVAVVDGGRLSGLLALADTVRPEAPAFVASLKRAGVRHVVLLTGDNAGTAKAISLQVGIDEYHAALLPEDKVRKVEELIASYGKVAMVGDGINDAPALARATVGIAMGTAGSDAALAAADVALMADDLSKLEYAIRLGRRSRRLILQNLAASMAIVVGLVAGTFLADLSMFAAVIGHEGSEVLIILNGLRVAMGR